MVATHDTHNLLKTPLAKKKYFTQTITIDKIMNDYDINELDILKMDIEGVEKEVFSDASRWIGTVKSIIVKLHERNKTGCNRAFYNNTNGFDNEWQHGEDIYLTRNNYITMVCL
jgi:hypothetical protein